MKDSELLALLEKATGQQLNEEAIGKLIDERLAPLLKAIDKKEVTVGDDPNNPDGKSKKATFSQWLGDISRMAKGEAPQFVERKDLMAVQVKSLYEGSSASGGYLVPTEESRELINLTNNWSVVMGLCRQVPMRTHQITFPTLSGGLTAYWIPETTADKSKTDPTTFAQSSGHIPSSDPTFGQMSITASVLAVRAVVSNELLDDSDPAVEAVLLSLFGETLGKYGDIALLRGAGSTTDPITGLASLITTNIWHAGADFDYDDIVDMIFSVYENAPTITQVPLVGHTRAEKMMLKIKDDQGRYIYKGPSEASKIPTVWGEPFNRDGNVSITLGDASNQTRIFAGDWANSAFVGMRQGVVIKANPFANPAFEHNQTEFLALMRVGFSLSTETRFAVLDGIPTN